jgi:hypothetical protein
MTTSSKIKINAFLRSIFNLISLMVPDIFFSPPAS